MAFRMVISESSQIGFGNFKMMDMKIGLLLFIFLNFICPAKAQLKFIVEDFEGCVNGSSGSDQKQNGIFTFGNIKSSIVGSINTPQTYIGARYIRLSKEGNLPYGGWGKGLGLNVELDSHHDYLNFYVNQSTSNKNTSIKIEIQEDDNGDHVYDKNSDDSWNYIHQLVSSSAVEKTKNKLKDVPEKWDLVSIPLNKFKDGNNGGDGIFNITYKHGKLLCVIITFVNSNDVQVKYETSAIKQTWYFDFICFSKGPLPTGSKKMNPPIPAPGDLCNIGAWSIEGNKANFSEIASGFESNFKPGSQKKLGVIHFFQSFAVDGGNTQNHYPSIDRINKIVQDGYIPMITLEDHFVNAKPSMKQPNLYSIVEGHFDSFFKEWANEIKQVNGIILLRILHEFNGDWYPWCIAKNDNNPLLLIKAFQHIHTLFREQQVTNVKFIWCPNSTSFPQEKWNFIMDAYPGDSYVDYIGLDIYNGAGHVMPVWRSFRKEGIENYFIITQQLPHKPLFICEAASRERQKKEPLSSQNKAEWIQQMSEALKTDMSKIRLLTWFNEKESFKVNSSTQAKDAFLNYIFMEDYFKSGTKYIYPMIHH